MPDPNAILLGVTGGIAIYKAADLCSKLSGAGYDVHVMMTDSARHLISDKLFFTLSRNPVIFDLWDTPTWKPGHIEISELASLMVIAPCTANFLGKYANGIADDALTTSAMAYQGEVLLAPAMNTRGPQIISALPERKCFISISSCQRGRSSDSPVSASTLPRRFATR